MQVVRVRVSVSHSSAGEELAWEHDAQQRTAANRICRLEGKDLLLLIIAGGKGGTTKSNNQQTVYENKKAPRRLSQGAGSLMKFFEFEIRYLFCRVLRLDPGWVSRAHQPPIFPTPLLPHRPEGREWSCPSLVCAAAVAIRRVA